MHKTRLILVIFMLSVLKGSHGATFVVRSSANLTTIVGAMSRFEFQVSATNFNNITETFDWRVEGQLASRVEVINQTNFNTTVMSGYNISIMIFEGQINMTFVILNTTSNISSIQVRALDGTAEQFTLTILSSCGSAPTPLTSTCETYNCNANSTIGQCTMPNDSSIIYSCYNTSKCMTNALWDKPKLMFLQKVGCTNSNMWGQNCSNNCGVGCIGSTCNFTTGACTCVLGYKGNSCNEIGCMDSSKWGQNCSNNCGVGCTGSTCNFTTGVCTCASGYMGDSCNEVGCTTPRKWGANCSNNCGVGCAGSTCNFTTGACTCDPGYKPDSCNECILGMHGASCSNNCSEGCPTKFCKKDNGYCANSTLINTETGCKLNYYGPACDENNCPTGKYGTSCNMNCSVGCPTKTCDKNNGSCANKSSEYSETGCKTSYIGSDCKQRGCVNNQTYGESCSMVCGYGCMDNQCDWTSGRCLNNFECLPGFKQDLNNTCTDPICGDCNGGVCVAPNLCQLCPPHFASGETCRNIRLDGFLKGCLPTFAILAGIVIFLSVTSKWYIRRKLKIA